MPFPKKLTALAAGVTTALLAAAFGATTSAQNPPAASAPTVSIDDVHLDWIERSNVAALREGVIERMELQIGMPVAKGKPIGYLHSELAELAVKKAELVASSRGPLEKAKAQKELAVSVVARNIRLNQRIPNSVSPEEVAKAEAELKVASAMILEEEEKIAMNGAELALARRTLEEHTIVAPFDGVVMERIKQPGESIRANESVVKLGNLSKLKAYFYVQLEYAFRVKEGDLVDFQPRIGGERGNGAVSTIEQKRFRGKITFIDPQIQPVAETARRVYAEFDNKDFELSPGLRGSLIIYLNSGGGAPAPAVGARTPSNGIGR